MSKKLEKLQEQLAKVQADIAAEEKRMKDEERKQRRRRIEIIGAYYLEQAEKNGGISSIATLLDKAGRLSKPADRALFDIPEPTPPAADPPPATT